MGAGLKAVVGGCAAALLGVSALVTVNSSQASAVACLPTAVQVSGTVPTDTNLTPDQVQNATTIVSVAVGRRLPSRAAVIAVGNRAAGVVAA